MHLPITGIVNTGGFQPTDISGLIFWLDGANPGVTSNQWDDKSGNSNHWTSPTSGEFPAHQSGDDSMLFDRTDDFLNGPNISALTEGEIFVRLKVTNTAVTNGIWDMGSTTNDDWHPYSNGRLYSGWGAATREMTGITPSTSLSVYHTLNIYATSSAWKYLINETQQGPDTGTTVTFIAAPTIGKSKLGAFWGGNMKAVVMFDRLLTAQERSDMNDYMDAL